VVALALLPLPTSTWRPGDGGRQAGCEAMVAVSDQGQVIGVSRWGGRTGLVWPADYTARRAPDGRVEIIRPDGQVAVREGEWFLVGGCGTEASEQDIAASALSAFWMQDEPIRVEAP
jgi:hypothetical protein